MDRFVQAQIAYTICELISQVSVLLKQYYSKEFEEINDDIIASMDEHLKRYFHFKNHR